jgi:hypothetical protein
MFEIIGKLGVAHHAQLTWNLAKKAPTGLANYSDIADGDPALTADCWTASGFTG